MRTTRWGLAGLALALFCTTAPAGSILPLKKKDAPNTADVPLEEMTEAQRGFVRAVLDRTTLSAKGPTETFTCRPELYYWFLDHPDRAVTAWKKIGAKCADITDRGDGRFGWSDEHGSDVVWHTVLKAPGVRVWYAEGKVRPAAALPMVPVKAVVVLRHSEAKTPDGATAVKHQSDLYVQTDSKVAAAFTKMMGQSAPKMAEQGLGQLQLFFSGLSWYLDRHPEQAEALLK